MLPRIGFFAKAHGGRPPNSGDHAFWAATPPTRARSETGGASFFARSCLLLRVDDRGDCREEDVSIREHGGKPRVWVSRSGGVDLTLR